MAYFPDDPFLLLLNANFLMEVRKDGPASRTQLQIATKHDPNIVERFQIFATIERSKQLKDAADGTMDLQAYVELKRNFRWDMPRPPRILCKGICDMRSLHSATGHIKF